MAGKDSKKTNKKNINIDVTYDGNCCSGKNPEKKAKWSKNITCKPDDSTCGGFVYFLGIIGAAVYFISTTTGFWMGVLGVLKAIVWPAFLIYGLLKSFGL